MSLSNIRLRNTIKNIITEEINIDIKLVKIIASYLESFTINTLVNSKFWNISYCTGFKNIFFVHNDDMIKTLVLSEKNEIIIKMTIFDCYIIVVTIKSYSISKTSNKKLSIINIGNNYRTIVSNDIDGEINIIGFEIYYHESRDKSYSYNLFTRRVKRLRSQLVFPFQMWQYSLLDK